MQLAGLILKWQWSSGTNTLVLNPTISYGLTLPGKQIAGIIRNLAQMTVLVQSKDSKFLKGSQIIAGNMEKRRNIDLLLSVNSDE